MTSRERVRNAMLREPVDRVPMDYCGNIAINQKLMSHFRANTYIELLEALHTDFLGAEPAYTGPRLHAEIENRNVDPEWGIHTRWIEHSTGGYWDYCDFPLQEADAEKILSYPMPNPDDFDYDGTLDFCKEHSHFAIYAGNAGYGDIINTNGMLRGMEQVLVDLALDEEAGLLLTKRRLEIQLAKLERLIDKCREHLTFLWLGEDLGTQHTPIISRELFLKHIRPWHKKFIDLAKSYGLPVMLHSCGSSSWAYPDFIEIGLDAVDTLQPEAANMSPRYLKEAFGDKLAFHGCISTAGPLAYGTIKEVEQNVREVLEIMMPGGGYCLAPTHAVQDNTPLENVLKLYECGLEYGNYK